MLVLDDSGSLISRELHGPGFDQILASEFFSPTTAGEPPLAPGDLYWALADNQGTVRDLAEYDALLDETHIVNHIEYDSFGNITDESATAMDYLLSRFRYSYTGQDYDEDADLLYYLNRWYSPRTGSFVSKDPFGFAAGDTNLKRYVGNSPTNETDPSGLAGYDFNQFQSDLKRGMFDAPLGSLLPAYTDKELQAVRLALHWRNEVRKLSSIMNRIYDPTCASGLALLPEAYKVQQTIAEIEQSFEYHRLDEEVIFTSNWNGGGSEIFRYKGQGIQGILNALDGTFDRSGGSAVGSGDEFIVFSGGVGIFRAAAANGIKGAVCEGIKTVAEEATGVPWVNPKGLVRSADDAVEKLGKNVDLPKPNPHAPSNVRQACFVAGTPVLTDRGQCPIERLETDTLVWAYDHSDGTWKLRRVVAPLKHEYDGDIVTIVTKGDRIQATGNHPFWVVFGEGLVERPTVEDVYPDERGLTPNGRWVESRHLKVGDVLLSRHDRTVRVESLSSERKAVRVYNIEVEGLHTYAVGELGLLVHNKPMRNTAQDKILTKGDIKKLQDLGHDVHELKGKGNVSKYDLYKDKNGNIYVKPKGGAGEGDPTGININDL